MDVKFDLIGGWWYTAAFCLVNLLFILSSSRSRILSDRPLNSKNTWSINSGYHEQLWYLPLTVKQRSTTPSVHMELTTC